MMVEYVKRLGSELERYSFGELEVLPQAHIPVVDSGTTKSVSTADPELSGKRLAECNAG